MRWRMPERSGDAAPTDPGSAPLWPALRSPKVADTWLALGIALFNVVSALGARHSHEHVPVAAVVTLAVMGLVLAARRRLPGTVLVAVAALVASLTLLKTTLEAGFVAVLIASYSAVVYGSRKLSACLIAAGVLVLAATPVGLAISRHPTSRLGPPFTVIIAAGGAMLVGWFIRRQYSLRAEQVRLLAESAELAAEHHFDEAQRVRMAERLRIARKLHDIVAHHISVVVIQAQGAQRIADREPTRALAAMAEVERTGRTALDEMRRLLGLLRSGEAAADESVMDESGVQPESERTALPGLADIDVLAERIRSAGLDVTISTTGQPCDVPDHVGLASYRIVQEALTNALKHAGPARVTICLDFTDQLQILVADDGRGAAARLGDAVPGAGRGISGMAERAAAAGGTLVAGPRPGGGFRVHATIPLAQS